MGQLTVGAASAFDMLEAVGDDGFGQRVTRQRFGEMARQVTDGAAFTIRDAAGGLVCVMGLWPEPDHAEAWLAVGASMRANLRPALGLMAGYLEAVARAAGVDEVRTYVRLVGRADRAGSRVAGCRMAAWLGFEWIGTEASAAGVVAVFSRRFREARHG